MITSVGRMPDEFQTQFIRLHRSTWNQDHYKWKQFVDLIIDFAENYDKLSINRKVSSRGLHVARSTESASNITGSNADGDQMTTIVFE